MVNRFLFHIKNYMSKDVPTIEDIASVTDAAKEMVKSSRGFLIILKGGRPVGIVTERDFVDKIIASEKDPNKSAVNTIMSSPLITIDPDDDFLKASELMQQKNIRRLPVVKDGIIYGVITARDIAQKCGEYADKSVRDIMRWASPLF